MASADLTTDEVIDLVRQLPPDRKRDLLRALAHDAAAGREQRMRLAETQLRRLALERGFDWDAMTDDQRETLVDELIHEDRSCR